jgi:hypothetical protein
MMNRTSLAHLHLEHFCRDATEAVPPSVLVHKSFTVTISSVLYRDCLQVL